MRGDFDCLRGGDAITKYLKVHFLSQRGDWRTPQDLYNELNEEFHFTLDACATLLDAKNPNFITPEENTLTVNWKERGGSMTFMNPPYGRVIGQFIEKAYQESLNGCTVVCLLPARVDTQWFHRICSKASEMRFLEGRLRFDDSGKPAPFPSMIVIFRPNGGSQ